MLLALAIAAGCTNQAMNSVIASWQNQPVSEVIAEWGQPSEELRVSGKHNDLENVGRTARTAVAAA